MTLATHTIYYRRPTDTQYRVWMRLHGTLRFAQVAEERMRRDFPSWHSYIEVSHDES